MTDASKFAEYSSKAKGNLDQIKTSLLRYDRNPRDREFLNDILKSINSIKSAAIPLGLSRTIELCHHLESLITLIREEKKELHQGVILVFSSSRERLGKLIFELETLQMERSKVKDLVRKIKEEVEKYSRQPEEPSPENTISKKNIDTKAAEDIDDRSLLPDEILNEVYDKELYQIYVEQLQENLSLLRSFTDSFEKKPNKQNTVNQCSDLLDKLQSSANYMGYDKLADFYLQWVAELEMAGVDLSLGTAVSFDFMDRKIKKIVGLFPEVKDVPADDSALIRIERRVSHSQDQKRPPSVQPEDESTLLGELSEPSGEIEPIAALADPEPIDGDEEPIAALADAEPMHEEEPVAALDGLEESAEPVSRKKEARGKKTIEIDGSFLEEEQQSGDYDKELFEIFVDQVKENLTQVRDLVEKFPAADNKSQIIDKCSNLVGKLQSSANYMGYERLAEYHLQWIAELEMAGVEISLGTDVTLEFMAERIAKITSLFLEKDRTSSPSEQKTTVQTPSPPEPAGERQPVQEQTGEPEIEEKEEEEETLTLDDPEMGGADFDFSEAGDMQLGSLFTNIEESEEEDKDFEDSFEAIAGIRGEIEEEEEPEVIPVKEYDDVLPEDEEDEEEPLAEGVEPIAGLSDKGFLEEIEDEQTPPLEERLREPEAELTESGEKSFGAQFSDALEEKLESFFDDVGEPEEEDDLESSFMEIASLSDAPELEESEDDSEVRSFEQPAVGKPIHDADIHDEVAALFDESVEDEYEEEQKAPVEAAEEEPVGAIAELSEDEDEEEPDASAWTPEQEPAGAVAELFDDEDEQAEPAGEFAEAVDDHMENFFTDMEEPEDEEESEAAVEEGEEEPAGAVAELFDDEDEQAEPAGEFAEAVDDHMENFFTDMEEPEDEEVSEAAVEEGEEEPAGAVAELFDDEDEQAEPAGEFAEAVDDHMENFFTDMEGPEDEEEPEAYVGAVEEEPAGAVAELFDDEDEQAEPAGEFAEAVDDHMENFFTDMEGPEDEEEPEADVGAVEEEPAGAVAELFDDEDEQAEPAGEFAEAVDDHMENFFTDMEEPEDEEEPEADVGAVEEEPAGAVAELFEEDTEGKEAEAEAEEELSDEELLREIQGPTVGLGAAAEADTFIPDIDAADKAISAISDGELTEEELFSKLEGAISSDEPMSAESEDQFDDDEDIEEPADITEEIIDTAPERKELFQKLSHALLELEEETADVETSDTEEQETEAQTPFDSGLFDRLTNALEDVQTADISSPRPIDQVMEEILSGKITEREESQTLFDSAPNKLAAAEIKQIIRMDSDKVDSLLDRFSELNTNRSALTQVLAEMNALHQHYQEIEGFSKQELKPLKNLIFRLGDTSVSLQRVANEIREGIIRVRMVPISLLFDRYQDFVEKLAKKSDKKVEIEIIGKETELEKIIMDEISEPLTQLVSNAVEHGIETMDQRQKIGKKKTGSLKLEAYQEESDIVIEIMDDGCGINLPQVKARAMDIGLYTGDELYKMSEKDLKNIIMEPGFSFTDGRGEGMHIVRTSVENIHGSIDIRSSAGKGTIIQVRVPFSLLIVKALKVKVGQEVMALPVTNIEEIIRMHPDKLREEEGKQSINWDNAAIPVYRLSSVFKIEPGEAKREKLDIILVRPKLSTERIGLIVDETAGLEEIIIKPIGETLRRKSGFAGVTIINEGGITLIPDIDEIVTIAAEHPDTIRETVA